ncbi:metallophosphoesterase [Cecembia rubra]|uniref:metallophosphoesterase n=1 Tax=Cecembia rubra TaxID=1485585 RepID=UPI002714EEB1|nr:metallophosphoesterase [Cecembia rubra]
MNLLGASIFLLAILLFSTFLNWYVFQAVKTLSQGISIEKYKNAVHIVYWLIFGVISAWYFYTFIKIFITGEFTLSTQTLLNVFLTVVVTQLVCVVFLFTEDLFRNIQAGVIYLSNGAQNFVFPGRKLWVSLLAVIVAMIPFFSFVYGMAFGKHNFKVHKETIYFEDLPEAFDGFTITQISDIHIGSFKNPDHVQKGIDLAIGQESDLFVFTGDLVNHRADEMDPFIGQFSKIKSPYGQFSIIGNHDYGDYISWPTKEAKENNFKEFLSQHEKIGFRLLRNEHVRIEKEGQYLVLLGVENWGVGFGARGDLEKALEGTSTDEFKILLSHDPSHWDEEVKKMKNMVHLTLSGHTHGMQFGIETPIIRWSPVQYRYPNWAGLASFNGRYLYVNRGFGFHAFSGRVGIWPEITVIELRKK